MAQASGSGGGETVALAIAAAGAAGVGWYLEQGNRVLGVPIPEFPFGIGKARYEQNLAARANVAIPESSPVSSTTVASTTSTAPATKATTSTSTPAPTHASRKTHVAQKTTPSPRISQVGVAPGTQNYRLTTAMTAAQVARAYGITAQELAALQTSASKRDLILQHPNELLAKGNVLVTPRPKKRVS